MFKPISAGLMCLGLATLGVTMLRGEVVVENEAAVETSEPQVDILFTSVDTEVIDPEVAVTGTINVTGSSNADAGNVAFDIADIRSDIAEIHLSGGPEELGNSAGKRMVVKLAHPAGVTDAATRESLEKIIKQLREDEAKLLEAKRPEEAAQKGQSAAALEAVIKGHHPFPKMANFRTAGGPFHRAIPAQALAARMQVEQAGLHARIAELQAKRAALQAQRPDAPEIADLDKAILDVKKSADERIHEIQVARQKVAADAAHVDHVIQFHANPWVYRAAATGRPEAASLKQKAEALLRAAELLTSAGLEDKARELREKGEKALAEAAELQARTNITFTHPVGPPGELHQALNELREQVQQLRKEVGEVRALLERKQ